jgi:hypothetical protein
VRALPSVNRKGKVPCDADRRALARASTWTTVGVAATKVVARLDKAGFRFRVVATLALSAQAQRSQSVGFP